MAYYINKTDGTAIVVLDGVKDNYSTSLTLLGRLAENYGEVQNENFVRLLENFAFSESPIHPTTGQLWYDTVNDVIKVYDQDTDSWKIVGSKIIGNISVSGNLLLGSESVTLADNLGVATLRNKNSGGSIALYANVAGVDTNVLNINGTDGLITVVGNATTNLGVTTKIYVDSQIGAFQNNLNAVNGNIAALQANLSLYALKNSPQLTGVPTAPTADIGANTTQLATTAFVQAVIQANTPDIDLSPFAPKISPVFSGVPTAPTPASTTSNNQIATTEFVQSIIPATIPRGIIVMWYGSTSSIPAGWYLCNGLNDTPDLRDKFVVGAVTDQAGLSVTSITGSYSKSGGTKDAVVVAHNHTLTDPGHRHYTLEGTPNFNGDQKIDYFDTLSTGATTQNTISRVQSATTGISIAATGQSGVNQNLPPYYALCYIMKG